MSSFRLRQTPDRCFRGRPTLGRGAFSRTFSVSRLEAGPGLCRQMACQRFLSCALFFRASSPDAVCVFPSVFAEERHKERQGPCRHTALWRLSWWRGGKRHRVLHKNALLKERDFSCGLFECVALGFIRISSVGSGVPTTVRKSLRG